MISKEFVAKLTKLAQEGKQEHRLTREDGSKLRIMSLGDIEVLFELSVGLEKWKFLGVKFEFLGIDFQIQTGQIYTLQPYSLDSAGETVSSDLELYSIEGTELEGFVEEYLDLRLRIAAALKV